MNSMPAASRARRTAWSLAAVIDVSLVASSARRIVVTPTAQWRARSSALHRTSARAALICSLEGRPQEPDARGCPAGDRAGVRGRAPNRAPSASTFSGRRRAAQRSSASIGSLAEALGQGASRTRQSGEVPGGDHSFLRAGGEAAGRLVDRGRLYGSDLMLPQRRAHDVEPARQRRIAQVCSATRTCFRRMDRLGLASLRYCGEGWV